MNIFLKFITSVILTTVMCLFGYEQVYAVTTYKVERVSLDCGIPRIRLTAYRPDDQANSSIRVRCANGPVSSIGYIYNATFIGDYTNSVVGLWIDSEELELHIGFASLAYENKDSIVVEFDVRPIGDFFGSSFEVRLWDYYSTTLLYSTSVNIEYTSTLLLRGNVYRDSEGYRYIYPQPVNYTRSRKGKRFEKGYGTIAAEIPESYQKFQGFIQYENKSSDSIELAAVVFIEIKGGDTTRIVHTPPFSFPMYIAQNYTLNSGDEFMILEQFRINGTISRDSVQTIVTTGCDNVIKKDTTLQIFLPDTAYYMLLDVTQDPFVASDQYRMYVSYYAPEYQNVGSMDLALGFDSTKIEIIGLDGIINYPSNNFGIDFLLTSAASGSFPQQTPIYYVDFKYKGTGTPKFNDIIYSPESFGLVDGFEVLLKMKGVEYVDFITIYTDTRSEISQELNVGIYPVPFQSELIIEINTVNESYQVKIYNVSGEVVYHNKIDGKGINHFPLEHLTEGIYVLTMEGLNSKIVTRNKIVKQ